MISAWVHHISVVFEVTAQLGYFNLDTLILMFTLWSLQCTIIDGPGFPAILLLNYLYSLYSSSAQYTLLCAV